MPLAGHSTFGAAFVIACEEVATEYPRQVTLNLKAEQVLVDLRDVLWMRQLSPAFDETLGPSRATRVLGLKEADLNEQFPAQEFLRGCPASKRH